MVCSLRCTMKAWRCSNLCARAIWSKTLSPKTLKGSLRVPLRDPLKGYLKGSIKGSLYWMVGNSMQAVASCLEEGACEDFPFASLVELSPGVVELAVSSTLVSGGVIHTFYTYTCTYIYMHVYLQTWIKINIHCSIYIYGIHTDSFRRRLNVNAYETKTSVKA